MEATELKLKIKVVRQDLAEVDADLLAVNLFKGVDKPGGATGAADARLGGLITQLIAEGEARTGVGKSLLLHTPMEHRQSFGPRRILVAGLGAREKFGAESVRRVAAHVARRSRDVGARTFATIIHGAGTGGMDAEAAAAALAEGALLGLYRFNKYFTGGEAVKQDPLEMLVVEPDADKAAAAERGIVLGRVLAESAIAARHLVNEPANTMTTLAMAEAAESLAERHAGIEARVLDEDAAREQGMGAFLGVAQGSSTPARFVHLAYRGDPSTERNVWLIGKSIIFDTGGISLKPSPNMGAMKGDMAGGAAVLGAIHGIASLGLKINVHVACAMAENMPSGNAQRPGDIVRAMDGSTIEVDNTDAEGRLTLADAVGYARRNGASAIVDVATLTNAIRIALGRGHSGGYSNSDSLIELLERAGQRAGEPIWRLPIDEWAVEQNRSKVADIKNTGGAFAGSITAAQFIQHFVGDVPWAHFDIAGTSMLPDARGIHAAGATGVMARTLVHFAMDLAEMPRWPFLEEE